MDLQLWYANTVNFVRQFELEILGVLVIILMFIFPLNAAISLNLIAFYGLIFIANDMILNRWYSFEAYEYNSIIDALYELTESIPFKYPAHIDFLLPKYLAAVNIKGKLKLVRYLAWFDESQYATNFIRLNLKGNDIFAEYKTRVSVLPKGKFTLPYLTQFFTSAKITGNQKRIDIVCIHIQIYFGTFGTEVSQSRKVSIVKRLQNCLEDSGGVAEIL